MTLILVLITIVFMFILYICKNRPEFIDVLGICGLIYAAVVIVMVINLIDVTPTPATIEVPKVVMEGKS